MNKFKVGDIVTGNAKRSPYSVTTTEALLEVTAIGLSLYSCSGDIKVEVIDHRNLYLYKEYVGIIYPVKSVFFRKISKIERILKFNK